MKTLIISSYDSCWHFSVYPKEECEDIYHLYRSLEFDKIIEKYKSKYDVIIICDDGDINIIKGAELLHD